MSVVGLRSGYRCKFGTGKLTIKSILDGSNHSIGLPEGNRNHGKHLGNFYFRSKKGQKISKIEGYNPRFLRNFEVTGPGGGKS